MSAQAPRGGSARPPWKPASDLTYAERREQQDVAAGGRTRRTVELPKGRRATGSVELKQINGGYRVYAYLRYMDGPRTVVKYIGGVPEGARAQALKVAWRLAREKGLLVMSS